jgi:hypothetical protein
MSFAVRVICEKCGQTYLHHHSGSKDYGPPPHSNCPADKKQASKHA